jgi:hypothetical protein
VLDSRNPEQERRKEEVEHRAERSPHEKGGQRWGYIAEDDQDADSCSV